MHFFFGWPTRLHRENNASTFDLAGKPYFHRGKIKPVLITDGRQDYVKGSLVLQLYIEAGQLNAGWITHS